MRLVYLFENEDMPPEVVKKYTCGSCLEFAEALSKLLDNAPLYSVVSEVDDHDDVVVQHVVVKYKNKYRDIKGGHEARSLINFWDKDNGGTFKLEPYRFSHWRIMDEDDPDCKVFEDPSQVPEHIRKYGLGGKMQLETLKKQIDGLLLLHKLPRTIRTF